VPSASEPAPSASAPVLANDDVPSPPKPAKAPSRAGKSASAHPAPSVLPSGTASAPAPTCALVPHVTENGDTYFTKECH
jgi:hypothetical protein